MKKCCKCGFEKELSSFYNGQAYCKDCQKQYYLFNKLSTRQKNYYYKNKDKAKCYYLSNRSNLLNKQKNYYNSLKENNIDRLLFYKAKQRAKKNGIIFDLNIKDISDVMVDICPLLNIPLFVSDGYMSGNSYSLDRINPEQGYIKGNIQVISVKANSSKNDASYSEYSKIVNNLIPIIDGYRSFEGGNEYFTFSSYVLSKIKYRCMKYNIPFNINKNYLNEIYPLNNNCPLLEVILKRGRNKAEPSSPSLDRIIPELGYVKGNVMFISHRANTIKSNLSIDEMRLILYNWSQFL